MNNSQTDLIEIAHHEAGHAVMACVFGAHFECVTIIPCETARGRMSGLYTRGAWSNRGERWQDVLVFVAGPAAQEISEIDAGLCALDALRVQLWEEGANSDAAQALALLDGNHQLLEDALFTVQRTFDRRVPKRAVKTLAAALLERQTLDYDEAKAIVDRVLRRSVWAAGKFQGSPCLSPSVEKLCEPPAEFVG